MLTAAALFVAGVALLENHRLRRLGAAGATALALGIAAARLPAAASAPPAFLAVNAGLQLLGAAVCLTAVAWGGRGTRGLELVGPVVGLAGAALAGATLIPLVAASPSSVAVAGTVGALGAGWSVVHRRLAAKVRARPAAAPAEAGHDLGTVPPILVVLSALVVGFGGHIGLVLAGAATSGVAAWLCFPPPRRPRPWAPVLAFVLLGATLWLLATVAGPEGLALAAIPALPLSPAAERLAGLLLAGAAWALSGLWPLRQPAEGVLTAPVGILVLLRLGLPAVPAGLEHWRAAIFPVVLIGMWHAALGRRLSSLATGGALLGAATLHPDGMAGAGWLLASAIALQLLTRVRRGASDTASPLLRVSLAPAAAWGAIEVLGSGLRTEAVYTVLAAVAVAVGLGVPPALTPPPGRSILPRDEISP